MTPNPSTHTRNPERAAARRRAPRAALLCLLGLAALTPLRSLAEPATDAQALVDGYIGDWKAFYPSRAFAHGDRNSAGAFEDFSTERVATWLIRNARVETAADALLREDGLDVDTRTDLLVLRSQVIDEQASWAEDEFLARQPQWYAERVSQALTHLLVRDQLSAEARNAALLERLRGVERLCRLGIDELTGGNAQRTERAVRTLRATADFYADGLVRLIATWPESAATPALQTAIVDAVDAIRSLEVHLAKLLPDLSDDPAIGKERYAAKLSRRSGGQLTPSQLRLDAREEMRRVRALMFEEARRWQQGLGDAGTAGAATTNEELLAAALEAMEADRADNSAAFLEQFRRLTIDSERFVVDNAIATVPQPTTLYVALSPAHFSGAAVGGVYPSGPFDPGADTLFYIPSVPDDAPAQVREGFYRSFNDHFNAMIISHEMFPGHYLQYKVAVSEAPAVRSLYANGAYIEGWGSFVEELLLDAGWADNAPLTRLAHLRKRLENATRATVSVEVHTAGWGQDQVLDFAREEGLLAPQFAENLWQRVVNSPLQITDYYVGWAQFQGLFRARPEGPLGAWVDDVLRAGPVPMALLPSLLDD